jgi:phosphoglycerate dehydrogenase-like enzyme
MTSPEVAHELPEVLNLLVVARSSEAALKRIKSVAPERLNVKMVAEAFQAEEQWPDTSRRGQRPAPDVSSPAERRALLSDAHVALMGFPFPRDFAARAPNLIWAHFPFAGVSNLKGSSFWGVPFLVTSTRGRNTALPIAESMLAAALMFARGLDKAVALGPSNLEGADFREMKLVQGKTMAIVGLGGIGGHLARLARACGMRVLATRRSAKERQVNVDGVDELLPPSELHAMLGEADFVAITAMLTDETEGMIDSDAFGAMKPGAYFMNTARGEIVDEPALVEALHSRRLGGAYLDVWFDDFATPPSAELQAAPNLVITPHVSGRSDVPQGFSLDVFCENLERLLTGAPLENVIDWERGY